MNKEMSLPDRIMRYFEARPGQWISSGTIQRLVVAYTKDTPRSAVRRMQELAAEKKLERKLVKNHTHYMLAQTAKPVITSGVNTAQGGGAAGTDTTIVHNPHTCQGCKENTLVVAAWV